MDYRVLTTLRETLGTYAHAVTTAPYKPSIPPVPEVLRQATNKLPPKEVIRELKALPQNIARLFIIREVCRTPSLRHAALQSSLLNVPKYMNAKNNRLWYKALGHLIDAWLVLEVENGDEAAISSLRQVRKRVEGEIPSNPGDSLPLATLLVTADARLKKVENLQSSIEDAVALLEKGHLAYSHDGLQEVVQSLWAEVRSEYPALSKLTKEGVEGPECDVVITRIEKSIAALRARHISLVGLGFGIPGLEVATGDGRERLDEDDDDEDEWEDGWEEPVKLDALGDVYDVGDADTERATAKPREENDGIEKFLKGKIGGNSIGGEVDLPPVTDWVSVVKGKEGDKLNRLLLDRLEEKAALETNGECMVGGVPAAVSRGQEIETRRGRRAGKKGGTTARQRISAKLGIRKRKKKSLLD